MVKSIGGIKRIFVAIYDEPLDLYYENVQTVNKGSYVLHTSTVKGINNALDWKEIPNHNGNASFVERLVIDRRGLLMNDVLTVSVAKQSLFSNRDLISLLEKKLIAIIEDRNGNYWMFGHDVHIELKIAKQTTANSNQYDLELEGFTLARLVNGISKEYINGIL